MITRQQATILSRALPIAFWLLAVAGTVATPLILSALNLQFESFSANYWWGFLVAGIVLVVIVILERLDRHEIAISEAFGCSLLLGIASYWLPSVLFLVIPMTGFLIARNHFVFRSFTAMLIGFATVVIWAAVGVWMGWIDNSWADFFATKNLWAWIPTGSLLIAYIASTIARKTLRVR